MNTTKDFGQFWSRDRSQLRKKKECLKSATTLVSNYITDKADWKPESSNFFKHLVACNVEATKLVVYACLLLSRGRATTATAMSRSSYQPPRVVQTYNP